MSVKEATADLISRLEQADWFTNVGKDISEDVLALKTWKEAVESCLSVEWENVQLDGKAQLTVYLTRHAPQRFKSWNSIVEEVKTVTAPLVEKKVQSVVEHNHLPERFKNGVRWDILHAAMEVEYEDIYPLGLYSLLAKWYVQGHIPCGWEGDFPEGKLIIF